MSARGLETRHAQLLVVIDYIRQSLAGVVREGLSDRIDGIFRTFGWDVVLLKHGALQ